MATQNPIETEGTYPLPEAQVDRFMMKVLVDYPSDDEEFVIVERVIGAHGTSCRRWRAPASSPSCSRSAARSTSTRALIQYAVRWSARPRDRRYGMAELAKYLTYGASPRASISHASRARARSPFLRGRNHVLPEDLTDLAVDALRHRLVLSYEALAEGIDADALIAHA